MTPCEMSENFNDCQVMTEACHAKKPMKPTPTSERGDLDIMAGAVVEAVDQEADADHLAVPERMREPEEGRRRHAPGDEVVARRNVMPSGRPPDSSIISTKIAMRKSPAR